MYLLRGLLSFSYCYLGKSTCVCVLLSKSMCANHLTRTLHTPIHTHSHTHIYIYTYSHCHFASESRNSELGRSVLFIHSDEFVVCVCVEEYMQVLIYVCECVCERESVCMCMCMSVCVHERERKVLFTSQTHTHTQVVPCILSFILMQ